MKRLLIANRGEIARRIARTARRLGVVPVMVCGPGDDNAPHIADVYGTTESTIETTSHALLPKLPGHFGTFAVTSPRKSERGAVFVDSYLDIGGMVAGAQERGVEAVHPGYGFCSERPEFARALEEAGIALVGPSAAVMEQMGRKDHAREIAVAAGVPVVPSYALTEDPATLAYPVLVKAAAGGGGKGMRVVHTPDEYADAVHAAAREAAKAFGDDTLLVEKYVESGRHIEVQVLADSHGRVVALGERDCSTQRRHQKVLEEAPAPTITSEQRHAITTAAVALAAQVGYVNAGTVEFLLDNATGEFYFLEMNTRLQVEHPVTEAVVRVHGEPIDLVEWQLRIADGEALTFTQADVTTEGHAIEARVYAEDAYDGFLPQAGTATFVHWPANVRVDHALESGQEVSTSYDPMLGKIIAAGADRETARTTLIQALDDTAIFGLTTNAGFLRALTATAEFADATIDTGWLDRQAMAPPDDEPARGLVAAALAEQLSAAPASPWQPDRFRLGGPPAALQWHGMTLPAPTSGAGFVDLRDNGAEVISQGQRFVFSALDPFADHGADEGDGSLAAPMPGTVLDVRVRLGDAVEAGATLGSLEAMKMEVAIKAPFAGVITEIGAQAGAQVRLGDTLFVVEAGDGDD